MADSSPSWRNIIPVALHWKVGSRHLRRHPWLIALSILGIALGVAVVVAVDLASHSARHAFALSTEAVVGRATHTVVGVTGTVEVASYQRLAQRNATLPMAPAVEATVTVADHPGHSFRLLGIDPIAELPFRPYLAQSGTLDPQAVWALAMNIGSVLMARTDADQLGIKPGDRLNLLLPNGQAYVTVAVLIDKASEGPSLSGILVMNVVGAQQLLSLENKLTRIDLLLPEVIGDTTAANQLAGLAVVLAPGERIEPANARAEGYAGMLRAFDFNLTALSLLSLLVGMFLVYNTLSFLVVQRRPLLGTLRTLGVTQQEMFVGVLGEAALLGVLATATGLVLGYGLAEILLSLVTRTINDVYFTLQVTSLHLSPLSFTKGVLLGIGGSVLATVPAAWEAAKTPPRRVLNRSGAEDKARVMAHQGVWLGAIICAIATVLLLWPSHALLPVYIGFVMLVAGISMSLPAFALAMAKSMDYLLPTRWLASRFAVRTVAATLSRTGVAIMALTIALATTVGMGIMISSFRDTVSTWLGRALSADVFISRGVAAPHHEAVLPVNIMSQLTGVPGVAEAVAWRRLRVETEYGPLVMSGFDCSPRVLQLFRLRQGDSTMAEAAMRDAARQPPAVLISEPLAYHQNLPPTSRLGLQTLQGKVDFEVAGVYQDYGSDQGRITTCAEVFQRYFGEVGISGVGVFLTPDADAEATIEALRALATPEQPLWVTSTAELRSYSMEVFDRTFTITAVLRFIALAVGVVGVAGALMALQLERTRELAVLRALGASPGLVGRMVILQTVAMGLISGIAAIPVGLVMAAVLTFIINRRAFGWVIDFSIHPMIFFHTVVVALVAALIAGIYPAWRMAQVTPAAALRDD